MYFDIARLYPYCYSRSAAVHVVRPGLASPEPPLAGKGAFCRASHQKNKKIKKGTPRWRMQRAVERHRRRAGWQLKRHQKETQRRRMEAKVDQPLCGGPLRLTYLGLESEAMRMAVLQPILNYIGWPEFERLRFVCRNCYDWLELFRWLQWRALAKKLCDWSRPFLNIDQTPFHMNEAGSAVANTLALMGAPAVPLVEYHAATRRRLSINTVTDSNGQTRSELVI